MSFLIMMTFIRIPFEFLHGEPALIYFNSVSLKTLYSDSQKIFANQATKTVIDNLHLKEISSLDGLSEKDADGEQVLAIMIENHPDSRAQLSGLSKAKIIYETEAEGGITRFLAIFNTFDLNKVGPVRSARPYFVDFAEEYNAIYAHAGGSEPALLQVHSGKILNAEALYYEGIGKYFYRDKNYFAPHNLFANLSELPNLIDKSKWMATVNERFNFISYTDKATEKIGNFESADEIIVDFSSPSYKVSYKYDPLTEKYERYLANKKHLDHYDESGVFPSNIIIQFTEYKPYDSYGRIQMRTTGKGDALLFSRGKVIPGYWEKTDITRFFDKEGQILLLNPGQTFIEIIKKDLVTWSASQAI